ncbi:MAG: hypothetical protein ACKVYV_19565 [Limisphaerales bacterium]
MHRPVLTAWLVLLPGLLPFSAAALDGRIYYEGSKPGSPSQQGLVFLTQPFVGAGAVQGATNGGWSLDSRPRMASQAGWFSRLPFNSPDGEPAMDRAAGFQVSFILQLVAEEHASTDRAGFSVIALASDTWGIELGFWTNAVWAQSGPDFQRAEEAAFDTTAAPQRYDVAIRGDRYALHAGGRPVLEGPLRNYASFGVPYNAPRFVFVGDDTSSASAKFTLGRVAAWTLPRLAIAAGAQSSQVTLLTDAEPGRPWVIEHTGDFGGWTMLELFTVPTNRFTTGDAVVPAPLKAYRLRAGD